MVAQRFLRKGSRTSPSQRILPLCDSTGIDHKKYSNRLQRLTVDMAAEASFASAVDRMMEHHSVVIPESVVRQMTLAAGEAAAAILETEGSSLVKQSPSCLVLEMDGVMVPIVEYQDSSDRRKTKTLKWKEIKVGAVQNPAQVETLYACSFEGANSLGDGLIRLVEQISSACLSLLHGVGDGAIWITEQGERVGGTTYSHLIDFFHLCEYFHAAFDCFDNQDLMVDRCKDEARNGQMPKVLRRLRRALKKSPKHEGIQACLRYIKNRPGQFAYAEARAKDLPIGSGLIESTNRSLIQKRLKLPGSWWLGKNVEAMAQLRVLRANNRWDELWKRAA